ncbi:MAG: tetratricopeptide repeat protein [bacterium]
MSFNTVRSYVLSIFAFVVIIFFLPFTQDFFVTAKWYLVGFFALALLLSSIANFLFSKKVTWKKKEFDTPLTLFIIAGVLSVLFGSTNKVQALINPHFGLLTFVFLFIIYYYVSRSSKKLPSGKIILSIFSVLFSVTVLAETVPFITSRLPGILPKFQNVTLAGTLFDALVFLGLMAVVSLGDLLKKENNVQRNIISFVGFVFTTLTAIVVLFTLGKNSANIAMPSFAHSWYSAVEVLKQPLTAFFGVGIDNFQSVFMKVKDVAYNTSPLWQIPSFSLSRTAAFHTMTEMGLLGLGSLSLILFFLVKKAFSSEGSIVAKLVSLYFVGAFLLLPPSFLLFFLLFVWIGIEQSHHKSKELSFDFTEIVPAYAALVLVGIVGVGGGFFMLGRLYMSEYMFQKSLTANNLKNVYETMRAAVSYNPYNERIRGNFAQVHLLIANTVAGQTKKDKDGKPQLSETDRQTVSQAIQAAIDEAKAVVALNPNKATNWELLATVYKSITGVVQGADTWTVSAYQRAIVLDSQNPTYRVALGGILYGYKQYDDAIRLFEQAMSLKPDWPNAEYNYAWAAYQKGDYVKAASAMQACVSLLNPKKDAADYKKASADLEEFKKKVPVETTQTQETGIDTTQQKESLSLPPTSVPQVEPKISLPKTASPEAK